MRVTPADAAHPKVKRSLAFEHAHTLRSLLYRTRADREALRQFQVRKLRVLLAHCNSAVAVYREHWRGSGLEPADIESPEDLAALPTIGKSELRACPVAETLADGADVRRLVHHETSGSTGEPFTIFRSRREEHLLGFFRMRAWRELGIRPRDRMAVLRELPDGGGRRGGWPARIRQALGIYRQEELDPYGPADATLERLSLLRPEVLRGYPSALSHVAARMQERDRRQLRPRLVLTGGELLSAAARRTIGDAFAAPLYDVYGAHEFNILAWQCPESGNYHVCDDNVIVEFVDGDGRPVQPGETGEIVATALHSYTMPFVRYRTGDLAVRGLGPCPCGRAVSTLRVLEGRTVHYLRLPGGRRVHPFTITSPLSTREAAWMRQHQIVQASEERVLLNILPVRAPEREELEWLQALGESILGGDVRFEVALVDGFAKHPSGKFHPYVSLFEDAARSEAGVPA
jgi:phenylacetate-CoA ligase